MKDKDYIVVVQCHIVKERCSGYLCERAFFHRTGLFEDYPEGKPVRFLSLTCGGCCGRALHRKLSNLIKKIKMKEKISKDRIGVHLSSCISFESYHGPECPHKEYLKEMIVVKSGLELIEGSNISKLTEKRRVEGIYVNRKTK
ncbi:MAG TPA: CGGC domain-containing protein [Victivallales bacterium]|nr:CGGC domain-containing protein [Victivallales bacterium]